MPGVFYLYPQQTISSSGQYFVLDNTTITTDGYQIISGFGSSEIALLINIKNVPTGTLPTLTFTLQEVDPIDQTTAIGMPVSSVALNNIGITEITKYDCIVGTVKVSWHISGTGGPTFTGVNATVLQRVAGSHITVDGYVSEANSTTTPLLANQIFTGVFQEVKNYAYITISYFSDVPAQEAIKLDWSGDGINVDETETISADTNAGRAVTSTVRARYFRIRYQNDGFNQTVFRLNTTYHVSGTAVYTKALDIPLNSDNLAQLTESVITGKRIDGYYGQVGLDNLNRLLIALANSAQLDAFGRLRISQPYTIFDSKMLFDNAPLYWDDRQTSGSGTTSTYNANNAYVVMGVGASTAGTRVRQTFRHFGYQPGKSTLVTMTGVLGAGTAGITRRLGYFDVNNGLYFDLSGTTLGVTVRTSTSGSVVNTKINQSAWNLDKMDGTGLSGIIIDPSKDNIFIIDFQWLGAGRVRFGFDVNGEIIYCHEVLNANINTTSYMANPNLPLRYEISNDGTGAASSLIHVCSAVIIEGGVKEAGIVLAADRGITPITTLNNTDLYPVIAIRLKSTAQQSQVTLEAIQIYCNTASFYRYTVLFNPTIVGTPLSFTSVPNSAIEYCANATNATTVTSGTGTRLASGYGEDTGSFNVTSTITLPTNLKLGSNIAGVSDIIVLAVQRITGTTEDFYGQITWREES